MSSTFTNIVRMDKRLAPTIALHVEVVADLVCPFCYLGKRRLDSALLAVNPDMPEEGLSLEEYLSMRFGSPANIEPVLEQLTHEGRLEDIDFRFDRISQVPNTLRAHRLMYLAESEGADQTALAEELMNAFFARGEDIGNMEILIELAGRHGLNARDAEKIMDDAAAKQVVLSREAQVRSSGIAGVPGYLLNRRLLVIGAQETDALVTAFDRAMFGEGNDSIVSPALH
jgi:predicted DsbA family dithiol-disulfide isomerase